MRFSFFSPLCVKTTKNIKTRVLILVLECFVLTSLCNPQPALCWWWRWNKSSVQVAPYSPSSDNELKSNQMECKGEAVPLSGAEKGFLTRISDCFRKLRAPKYPPCANPGEFNIQKRLDALQGVRETLPKKKGFFKWRSPAKQASRLPTRFPELKAYPEALLQGIDASLSMLKFLKTADPVGDGKPGQALSCADQETYFDLVGFSKALVNAGFPYTHQDIFNLFRTIGNQREQWVAEAKGSPSKVIQKEVSLSSPGSPPEDSLAFILIKEDGDMIIKFKEKMKGEGSTKKAMSRLGVSGKAPNLTSAVRRRIHLALVDLEKKPELDPSDVEKNQQREAVIQKARINFAGEVRTLKMINRYRAQKEKEGVRIRGLIHTDIVPLHQNDPSHSEDWNVSLIQDEFDGDLDESGFLRTSNRLKCIRGIAEGLTHVHAMGLIHADLKGKNILVKKDCEEVAVTDFGLTYPVTDPFIITRTTAGYEAPEMYHPKKFAHKKGSQNLRLPFAVFGQKRDVYSFGAIALHGIPGFEKVDALYTQCKEYFVDYQSWGKYGPCIEKAAPLLHDEIVKVATKKCGEKSDTNDCYEWVTADALNPYAGDRPTISEIHERLLKIER